MTRKFDDWKKLTEKPIWRLKTITRNCPDCNARTKKQNQPTLSDGGFLDQIIYCDCGWCGVDSIGLTAKEEAEFLEQVRAPKQLRLL